MDCSVDDVIVFGADSDASPYDSGSYASSTPCVTGRAVEKNCQELKEKICTVASEKLDCKPLMPGDYFCFSVADPPWMTPESVGKSADGVSDLRITKLHDNRG